MAARKYGRELKIKLRIMRGDLCYEQGPDGLPVRIVDKRKARKFQLPSLSELRRIEMTPIYHLVCLSALSALWLNGKLHVNFDVDVSLSVSVTALVLIALLKR